MSSSFSYVNIPTRAPSLAAFAFSSRRHFHRGHCIYWIYFGHIHILVHSCIHFGEKIKAIFLLVGRNVSTAWRRPSDYIARHSHIMQGLVFCRIPKRKNKQMDVPGGVEDAEEQSKVRWRLRGTGDHSQKTRNKSENEKQKLKLSKQWNWPNHSLKCMGKFVNMSSCVSWYSVFRFSFLLWVNSEQKAQHSA